MKHFFCILIILLLALPACSKVEKKSEVVNEAPADLKNVHERTTNALAVGEGPDNGNADEIVLTEENVGRFYFQIGELARQYPEIDFTVSTVASVTAGLKGESIQGLIAEHTDLSFDEYSTLSLAIAKVRVAYTMISKSAAIHKQLKESEKKIAETDLTNVTGNEKADLEKVLAKTREQIVDLERRMKSDEFKQVMRQSAMIDRVRKRLEK
ncbi:MAG: hypothetical protein KKE17_12380 [Proteobacteria bacterium]|nr:hypothetical protein [Pseudomonadota bacterium]MBU1710795.1 hypothetical protein [Pseudomonadota bacterium]